MILVDTDILVDVTRNHAPALRWLADCSNERLALSGFTIVELLSGCRDSTEQRRVNSVLRRFAVKWLFDVGANRAIHNYETLHLSHHIRAFDVLIGQTAVELGLPLHTFNVKHFRHVPGLTTIQPYKR